MSLVIVTGDYISAITGGVYKLMSSARAREKGDVLLHTPSIILADYIIGTLSDMGRHSSGDDWPLFVSYLPEGDTVPVDCGAIYDTAGILDGRTGQGEVIQHYGFMIHIRSSVYDVGWKKAEEIADDLSECSNNLITVDSTEYLICNVTRTSPVTYLGLDKDTERVFLFSVNFITTLKKIES